MTEATNLVNMRARGRRVKVKYSTDSLGNFFQIGTPEFGVREDGMR